MPKLLPLLVSALLLPLAPTPAQAATTATWVLPGVEGVGATLESTSGKLRLEVSS